jgi:hypothetical protein
MFHDSIAALEVPDIYLDIIQGKERLVWSDATGVVKRRSKDVGASAQPK